MPFKCSFTRTCKLLLSRFSIYCTCRCTSMWGNQKSSVPKASSKAVFRIISRHKPELWSKEHKCVFFMESTETMDKSVFDMISALGRCCNCYNWSTLLSVNVTVAHIKAITVWCIGFVVSLALHSNRSLQARLVIFSYTIFVSSETFVCGMIFTFCRDSWKQKNSRSHDFSVHCDSNACLLWVDNISPRFPTPRSVINDLGQLGCPCSLWCVLGSSGVSGPVLGDGMWVIAGTQTGHFRDTCPLLRSFLWTASEDRNWLPQPTIYSPHSKYTIYVFTHMCVSALSVNHSVVVAFSVDARTWIHVCVCCTFHSKTD